MSDLAEYARFLHENERREYPRELGSRMGDFQNPQKSLRGIRAVIFDVYGTLINYWRPGFEDRLRRENLLLEAFGEISARFEMDDVLAKMNPADAPAKTLNDFYNGLVALNHQKSADKGIVLPEVKVDEVWAVIVMMLKRNGYDAGARLPKGAASADFHRYLAYTYNFLSMGRELYPGVADALRRLKGDNIVLGILSDAQLYTPIDLTLLLRDQSRLSSSTSTPSSITSSSLISSTSPRTSSSITIDDYNEMFDTDLTFFSYEYGFVKPSEVLYRRLFDALYEYQILPSQTVFVGNDLQTDINPAAALGMKTALFCGDDVMVFGADGGGADAVPDIVFNDWNELPDIISFHGENE